MVATKQLSFDGISPSKPKKNELENAFAIEALKKQSMLVLDFIKEQAGEYPEKILKRINKAGVEFEMSHLRASLKWLVNHSLVVKETKDRVSFYSAREAD